MCKTFHGGLTDLKYVPKRIKRICRNVGEKHNPCLLEVYRMYIGLVECKAKVSDCFYLRAAKHKFSFEKSPVGIHMLNAILPNMCKEVGILISKLEKKNTQLQQSFITSIVCCLHLRLQCNSKPTTVLISNFLDIFCEPIVKERLPKSYNFSSRLCTRCRSYSLNMLPGSSIQKFFCCLQ